LYVLGAGCSHHAGAPLLRDFLLSAKLLREGKKYLKYKEAFDNIFKWIDSLRGASYYVELDLDNLEHIFSLAEMLKQLGFEKGEEYFSDLRYVVMETLDRCQIQWTGKRLNPDDLYYQFVKLLNEINDQRQKIAGTHLTFEKDTIITLNYDVMLDYAMNFHSTGFEYCLTSEPPPDNHFRILKLHGSTNWASCRECDNQLQIIPANPIPPGHELSPSLEDHAKPIFFEMVTNVLPNTPCKKCGKEGTLEPVVIPPTWSKAVVGTPLTKVWETAVNETEKAFQIIVIGYSMPPTDTFFQYLLTLGLSLNANLHRVVVINKDSSDEFKQRYEKVFSRSLRDRGHLKFLGMTFEEFVKQIYMRNIGSQTGWKYE